MDNPKGSVLPQRVITGIMAFLAIVVAFLMRACLSVAITEMVIPLKTTESSNQSIICTIDQIAIDSTTSIIKTGGSRYNWNQEQQGWILSSFFVGYLITHIPGAIFAQKFGGKWSLSLGILATIICNVATPLATEYGGYKALIFLRMTMGLIGFLISFYISGLILSYFPWPVVFYFWSAISFIWFIVFTMICSSDPASHPYISQSELDYLKSELGQLKRQENLPSTPWKDILTNVPIITLIISQVCNDFVFYVLASDLPKYMKEVLGFPVRDVGLYSSLPYFLMWSMSMISGFICDYLISRNYLSVTQARKFFSGLGSVIPAICIVAASYAGCNKLIVVIWFAVAMGFMGNYYPGLRVNLLDLSPNYAGSIMALSNGIASLAGIAAPTFVGMMTPDASLEQWRFVFWFSFGVSMFRTVIYSLWASGEVQPWNDPVTNKVLSLGTIEDNTKQKTTKETTNK